MNKIFSLILILLKYSLQTLALYHNKKRKNWPIRGSTRVPKHALTRVVWPLESSIAFEIGTYVYLKRVLFPYKYSYRMETWATFTTYLKQTEEEAEEQGVAGIRVMSSLSEKMATRREEGEIVDCLSTINIINHPCQRSGNLYAHVICNARYRVFIKYCVFYLKFCDFSELCQFCCSAGFLPAGGQNFSRDTPDLPPTWSGSKKSGVFELARASSMS